MPGLFVTATGTDVGKTFVAAGLLRAARRAGRDVAALKPVLTGFHPAAAAESDAGHLLAAMGRPTDAAAVAAIAPWRYAAPLSPDMAAAAANTSPPGLEAVTRFCRDALDGRRWVLIEGIGGVMVPLDRRHTVLDLMAALDLPILLLAPTGLGAISHTLTAMAALASRRLAPALLLLVESAGSTVSAEATRDTLAAFCSGTPIALLARDPPKMAFADLLDTLTPSRPPRTAA